MRSDRNNDPLAIVRAAGRASLSSQSATTSSHRTPLGPQSTYHDPLSQSTYHAKPRLPLPLIDPHDERRTLSPRRPGTAFQPGHRLLLNPKKCLPDLTMSGRPAVPLSDQTLRQWNRVALPLDQLSRKLGIPLSAREARALLPRDPSLHPPPSHPHPVTQAPQPTVRPTTSKAPPATAPPQPSRPPTTSSARVPSAASRHARFSNPSTPQLQEPSDPPRSADRPLTQQQQQPPSPSLEQAPSAPVPPPATASHPPLSAFDPATLTRRLMMAGSIPKPPKVPAEVCLKSTYARVFTPRVHSKGNATYPPPATARPETAGGRGGEEAGEGDASELQRMALTSGRPGTTATEGRPDTGFSFFRGDSLDVSQLDRLPTVDLTRLSTPGPYSGLQLAAHRKGSAAAGEGSSRTRSRLGTGAQGGDGGGRSRGAAGAGAAFIASGSGRSTPAAARQAKPLVLSLVDPTESTPEVLDMELGRMTPSELEMFYESIRRKNAAAEARVAAKTQ